MNTYSASITFQATPNIHEEKVFMRESQPLETILLWVQRMTKQAMESGNYGVKVVIGPDDVEKFY